MIGNNRNLANGQPANYYNRRLITNCNAKDDLQD